MTNEIVLKIPNMTIHEGIIQLSPEIIQRAINKFQKITGTDKVPKNKPKIKGHQRQIHTISTTPRGPGKLDRTSGLVIIGVHFVIQYSDELTEDAYRRFRASERIDRNGEYIRTNCDLCSAKRGSYNPEFKVCCIVEHVISSGTHDFVFGLGGKTTACISQNIQFGAHFTLPKE